MADEALRLVIVDDEAPARWRLRALLGELPDSGAEVVGEAANADQALAALRASAERLAAIDFATLSDRQLELGFDLLEHEIQHHGQLIRYVYGNRLSFPSSWSQRYTV